MAHYIKKGPNLYTISPPALFPNQPAEPQEPDLDPEVLAEHILQLALAAEQIPGNDDNALALYLEAEKKNPQAPGILVNIGSIFLVRRNWKEAEGYYRRAILADPKHEHAHHCLGNLFHELHKFPEAMACYREVLAINPRYADALFNIAGLYVLYEDWVNAITHYEAFLACISDAPGYHHDYALDEVRRLKEKLPLKLVHNSGAERISPPEGSPTPVKLMRIK